MAIYLAIVFLFTIAYQITDSVQSSDFSIKILFFEDYFYFSFVTQSTIGYGDFHPRHIGKFFVIIQSIMGIILVAIGTGVIVYKFLSLHREGIQFDRFLIFDPVEKRFRVRVTNRLPFPVACSKIEMRLRYRRVTERGEGKWSRKTVALLRNSIMELPPLRPFLLSTKQIQKSGHSRNFELGEEIVLQPSHLSSECSIMIFLEVNSPSGFCTYSMEWTANNMCCGKFLSTYDDTNIINWSNWGKVTESNPEACELCDWSKSCSLCQKSKSLTKSPA